MEFNRHSQKSSTAVSSNRNNSSNNSNNNSTKTNNSSSSNSSINQNSKQENDVDKSKNKEENTKLRGLIMKLSMSDQLQLYHNHQDVAQLCDGIWRSNYKRLDFRQLQHELSGDNLNYFLSCMQEHFRYVYFTADRLQDNLNILERAAIKALDSVQHCELLMSSPPSDSQQSLPCESGAGDAGLGRVGVIAAVLGGTLMPQWPLHALPKMLRNLRRLKVHCEVQVHFIEQFPQLELLVLYGDISQSALTGILERCKQLKRLFIKCKKSPSHLKGIDNCSRLEDVSLPIALLQPAQDAILALPMLHMLELTGSQQLPELIVECMRLVIKAQAANIEIIQLNCGCFEGPLWMRETSLSRCKRLQGLVLNNCKFDDREIVDLKMPRVHNYLVLSGCPDLKEYQLLDIVKKCPHLSELYLVDCPLLTGKVLHDIYRVRSSEKLDYPISIVLSRCDAISNDYQEEFFEHWESKLDVLKLDCLLEENRPIEDLQLFFYKNPKTPPILEN
ncbi:uncharacterized protein LOC117568078 [Drosophila albomicans]|uniref:Uncharacterized protein LOC117568078 n=1 Tax=Drosophila albomicans TaxID=7291 RepID=A0A6P8Y796_DROAB|nr:uncharacterized protein LOC117568078 [Drosophila albomicans]